ncbi:hypothetical protein [Curtobacterium sp. ME26]|uniref:hypothetical protein n=1 Tax=Curtobacterium sp. ME26 TaxID=2744254 RepID=UPI0015F5FD7E|nr:hypothetical protein [Curtobacterium sp. ME26]
MRAGRGPDVHWRGIRAHPYHDRCGDRDRDHHHDDRPSETATMMRAIAIKLFIIGAVPFASGIVYYFIDYKRTGKLYRKKLPWFPIIITG